MYERLHRDASLSIVLITGHLVIMAVMPQTNH